MKAFLIVLASLFSSACFAGDLSLDPARTVTINGMIGNSNILRFTPALMKMSENTTKPINLIINSPGGDVITGFLFINVMEELKAKGIHLRCFVPGLAASMAFQILVHCSERHTLDRAVLLWHRVRVILGGGLFSGGTAVTAPSARELAVDLQALDDIIFRELNDSELGDELGSDVVQYHLERETMHVGSTLGALAPGFITSHAAIPGLLETLVSPTQAQGVQERMQFKPGQIIYLLPEGSK